MYVLVDSSVWIDYFRHGRNSDDLEYLLDENLLVSNDIILAELLPCLRIQRQQRVISLLGSIRRLPLTIDWQGIIDWQYRCLRTGLNGVGLPDLLIAQNAVAHRCKIYSLDRHFRALSDVARLLHYPS